MKRIVVFFLSLLVTPHALADTVEYQLDNGLKLIVREDHRAPVVVTQVWYKVGSSYEPGGLTGLSHMLEHMMFKSTKNLGEGEYSRIIAENGGEDNAFTSSDYTTYFQTLGQDRLETSFRLEAERMHALQLKQEEFAKEQRVVMEERRLRTEDKPPALLYEQFNALAYLNHPYRNPIIGWMNDIENYQLADLQQWYERWYNPANTTLVIAGDVRPEEVHRLALKYFAPLRGHAVTQVKPQREVEQRGLRRVVLKKPAQLPYLIMGYHAPRMQRSLEQSRESYALLVLAGVLDGGASARLASRLVRGSEIAAEAGAGYEPITRDNPLFLLSGTPSSGHTVAELEAALREQIRQAATELVSAGELQRVKNQVIAEEVYGRDSVFYQAMQIGRLETVGLGWRMLDEFVDGVKRVTAEEIRQVAQKYLHEDNLTVAELVPLPMQLGAAPTPEYRESR